MSVTPDLVVFLIGHGLGWWLGFRLPHLVPRASGRRPPVSVIIPARDEETNVAECVVALHRSTLDEVIVVDDHSRDATAQRAASAGATVVHAPPLAAGWLGKPAACWHGASLARHDVLVFVDADVRLGEGALDTLARRVVDHPERLQSVQPWHRFGAVGEHAALPFNVLATMSARSVRGGRSLAFGPVLACDRARYVDLGGHADERVRGAVVEDVAIGELFGEVDSFLGSRHGVTFQMYPEGLGAVIRGFTRSVTAAIGHTDRLVAIAVVAWCASLVGGPLVWAWAYPLGAVQFYVVARRSGSASIVDAVLHPLHVLVATVVILRGAALRLLRREQLWRGRRVPSR
jgi:4,4'-diaponeurosporenoate glycosyltransferase